MARKIAIFGPRPEKPIISSGLQEINTGPIQPYFGIRRTVGGDWFLKGLFIFNWIIRRDEIYFEC